MPTSDPRARDLLIGVAALRAGLIRSSTFGEILTRGENGAGPADFTSHLRAIGAGAVLESLLGRAQNFLDAPAADLYTAVTELSVAMAGELSPHEAATIDAPSHEMLDLGPESAMMLEEAPGRYSFPANHAQGGMGRILIVYDEVLARRVALKELLPPGPVSSVASTARFPEGQAEPLSRQRQVRFLNEARITGQLEHPSIVPVYELGQRADGKPYYTMRLVRGRSLRDAIRASEGLAGRLGLLPHFTDLCQAIAFAHSRGVIHRDIKPGNVMVGEFGETVVIDWGLAKSRRPADRARPGDGGPMEIDLLAGGEGAAGTPAYMPPEQARGSMDAVDERSDVYALGAVLYKLLTGVAPYRDTSPSRALNQLLTAPPDPVSTLVDGAPEALVAICNQAMAREPGDRYQTAGELAIDVEHFLTGRLVGAYQYGPAELLRHFARRFKAPLIVGAIGLAILSATVAVAYRQNRVQRNRAIAESQRALNAEQVALDARETAEQEYYFAAIASSQKYIADFRFEKAMALLDKCAERYRHWEWGHLLFQCNQDQRTLYAHTPETVWSLEFAPDGKRAFSAGFDHTAKVWNVATGDLEHTYTSPNGPIIEVAPHPTLPVLACAEFGGFATLYDTEEGAVIRTWQACTEGDLNCVRYSPDGRSLATGDDSGRIQIYDTSNYRVTRTITPGNRGIEALEYSPDGTFLASADRNQDVNLWDARSGALVRTLQGHNGRVTSLSFSPDGALLASGGRDATVLVWRVDSGEAVQQLVGHDAAVWAVAFAPDGTTLATASSDLSVQLWDTAHWTIARTLHGHPRQVDCLAFSPDSRLLLTGDDAGAVKQWAMSNPDRMADRWVLRGHTGIINHVAYSPDGGLIATAAGDWKSANDTTVRIWDGNTGAPRKVLYGHTASIRHVAFHPSRPVFASSSHDHTIRLWDRETLTLLRVLGPWESEVNVSAFDPNDPDILAAGLRSGQIILINWTNGTVLREAQEHESEILSLNFSPDGQWLVSSSADRTFHVLRRDTGERVHTLQHLDARIPAAAFSPDGQWLATGGHDWQILLWNTATWESEYVLQGHTQGLYMLGFSDDGRRLISSSGDDTTIVWDLATRREVLQLEGQAAAFRPGSSDIVTGATDGMVYVWPAFHWDSATYPGAPGEPLEHRAESQKQQFWQERLRP